LVDNTNPAAQPPEEEVENPVLRALKELVEEC
jgi:hypothetical protein